ncbi:MAG TPA: hypothetical protein VG101_11855 [Puia sp.]|jgi:hypothetical protein|nr:hypothetical protein [Puia sp.]
MKKFLLTITASFCIIIAFSQYNHRPPTAVQKSFQHDYPQSKPGHWSHSGGNWNVSFTDRDNDNGEVTAHYGDNGEHTDTYIPYDRNDVPAPVMDNVKKNYSDYGNSQFTRVERADGNSVYRVNLRNKKTHKTVYVDEGGNETKYRGSH